MQTTGRSETVVPAVLLVSDRAESDHALREIFAQTELRCVSATPGDDALAALEGDLLALVLDVPAAINASPILAKARARQVPIVVVTADTSEATLERLCEEGPVDCLARPASPAALRAKVRIYAALTANRVHVGEAAPADAERTQVLAMQPEDGLAREANDALPTGLRAAAERDSRPAESERSRLYGFLMSAPAAICVLRGPEHVFELVNPLYHELAGGRDLLGQSFKQAIPELEGQGFYELLDQVAATGEAFVGKEVAASLVRAADGEVQRGYFNFTYQPMRGNGGAFEGILVHAVEVTEQVVARTASEHAVAEARRLNAELRNAESLLRNLVDNLPELAWSARADGHIDFYNRRWYEYTGTTFESMQGWGWKDVHDPTMVDAVTERWQLSLDTGEPFEMEFPLRATDGELRWFLTRVRPLRDDTDTIVRWFGVNTYIHEQREAKLRTEALLTEVSQQALATAEAVRQIVEARDAAERRVSELESRTKARE